eukprot:TRINITY_DN21823_c0_g1_i1.p1 TRINITY_DN21823_c0_g1~~TRINITY_DN21823_c0_g1_i1.p1  ORF type:complete len:493 (-),score=68.78 TRINITY_DN21823_c0_g1_i1:71-1525(-)
MADNCPNLGPLPPQRYVGDVNGRCLDTTATGERRCVLSFGATAQTMGGGGDHSSAGDRARVSSNCSPVNGDHCLGMSSIARRRRLTAPNYGHDHRDGESLVKQPKIAQSSGRVSMFPRLQPPMLPRSARRRILALIATVGSFRAGLPSVALLGMLLQLAAASSCWVGSFTREFCCDARHGPGGNEACWDTTFTYDPCCTAPADVDIGNDMPFDMEILERTVGPQLERALADNGPASVEAGLRASINSPENRSMAEQTSRIFLAVLLYRQGRRREAAAELREAAQQEDSFSISASGVWVGTSAAGYHMHDVPFAEALVAFLRRQKARTIGDFGCGMGLYVRDLRAAGFRAGGFDGNPSTLKLTDGRCHQADLSHTQDFGVCWDWILSLEVAEHIPPEFEGNFIGNLARHARVGLVLSWGNQAGEGHVNLHTRSEVERLFRERGFRSVETDGEVLRRAASLPWLQSTVLVLEREPPLPRGVVCATA